MSATKDSTKEDVRNLIEKANQIISMHVYNILEKFCRQLLMTTDFAAEYYNVTGNTFTSYACGLYVDGRLMNIIYSKDLLGLREPTRMTLKYGEAYDKKEYYDGGDPTEDGKHPFVGNVHGSGNYIGYAMSTRFLRGYSPRVKKGFCVCMCTGTYYSTYIEKSKNLNVLSDSYEAAKPILIANLTKIP